MTARIPATTRVTRPRRKRTFRSPSASRTPWRAPCPTGMRPSPRLKQGRSVIIAAHGNSLRALVKIWTISDRDIVGLDIPTGIPLVYELDDRLSPIKHYYLADEAELQKAVASVKSQGKAK